MINDVDESEDCVGVITNTPPDVAIVSKARDIKEMQLVCVSRVEASSDNCNLFRRGDKNVSGF